MPITERTNADGSIVYRVTIRKRGKEIYRTFREKEDAIVYEKYKTRLIDLMDAYEVGPKDTVTLEQIFEVKLEKLPEDSREKYDFMTSLNRLKDHLKGGFLAKLTIDDWLECAQKLLKIDVYRGGKTESCKRKMSPTTLRKIFAHASSCISHAQSLGIPLENHPLKIIQSFIRNLEKQTQG